MLQYEKHDNYIGYIEFILYEPRGAIEYVPRFLISYLFC